MALKESIHVELPYAHTPSRVEGVLYHWYTYGGAVGHGRYMIVTIDGIEYLAEKGRILDVESREIGTYRPFYGKPGFVLHMSRAWVERYASIAA